MKYLKQFVISYSGLKEGEHWFDFKVETPFFECFENEEILNSTINVGLNFIKRSTMLELQFEFDGIVETECDRCLMPVQMKIIGNDKLYVKFGNEEYSSTDEIIVLPHGESEIDVSQMINELILVALPMKRIHEKDCTPEALKKHSIKEEKNDDNAIDPRWSALKNIDKN